jgi:hypothetical protein
MLYGRRTLRTRLTDSRSVSSTPHESDQFMHLLRLGRSRLFPNIGSMLGWGAHGGRGSVLGGARGGQPGLDTFAALSAADPAGMRSQDLPDLMVAADRLISSLQAMQMAAVAEFARPGRAAGLDRTGHADRKGRRRRLGGRVGGSGGLAQAG